MAASEVFGETPRLGTGSHRGASPFRAGSAIPLRHPPHAPSVVWATDRRPNRAHNGVMRSSTEREGTTTMATKKITPVNPDTKTDDEAEAEDATAERKTTCIKAGRKTAAGSCRF